MSVGLQELDYFPAYGIDFCGAEDIDIKASIPVWSRLVSEMAYHHIRRTKFLFFGVTEDCCDEYDCHNKESGSRDPRVWGSSASSAIELQERV